MNYRTLGRTGLRVGEIGHGMWGMGDWSGSSDERSLAALEESVILGCNFFDSAAAYGNGHSDALLGKLVERHGHSGIICAGKVPPKNEKWPASEEDAFEDVFPLEHVLQCAERSRRLMKVEAIDVLQLHVWHDAWADDPQFGRVVEALKKNGLARFFGLSLNRWEPWNGINAIRTGLVDCVQVIYNIFDQAPEDELFPLCAERDIGVIARVPFDEGSLTGGITLDIAFPSDDWRARYFGRENLRPTVERVERLKKILPPEMSLAELAVRFILSNPVVSTIIAGMRSVEHVRANAGASDGALFDAAMLQELKKHRWDRAPAAWSD